MDRYAFARKLSLTNFGQEGHMAFLRGPRGRILVGVVVLLIIVALAQNPVVALLYMVGVVVAVVVFIRRRLSQGPIHFSLKILWHGWVAWVKSLVWPLTLTMHLLAQKSSPTRPTAVF